jgi:hypothetical protein
VLLAGQAAGALLVEGWVDGRFHTVLWELARAGPWTTLLSFFGLALAFRARSPYRRHRIACVAPLLMHAVVVALALGAYGAVAINSPVVGLFRDPHLAAVEVHGGRIAEVFREEFLGCRLSLYAGGILDPVLGPVTVGCCDATVVWTGDFPSLSGTPIQGCPGDSDLWGSSAR